MECLAIDPLCGAHPIQVGGDASDVHRPAGACDHAEVDVLSGYDHVVFQDESDFLSERVLHADQDVRGVAWGLPEWAAGPLRLVI